MNLISNLYSIEFLFRVKCLCLSYTLRTWCRFGSRQNDIKAALYIAMREENVNKSELARRLDIDVREVRRMLNPHHGTKLPAIEQAFAALGKHVELHITGGG